MYNWSTDLTQLKKNPEEYAIWKLEQQLNFGLNGSKIDKRLVKKYWDKLDIDPQKKNLLSFLLWPVQS